MCIVQSAFVVLWGCTYRWSLETLTWRSWQTWQPSEPNISLHGEMSDVINIALSKKKLSTTSITITIHVSEHLLKRI